MLKKTISKLLHSLTSAVNANDRAIDTVEGPISKDKSFTKLYEDENCLVIDKPSGVMVHPAGFLPQGEEIEMDEVAPSLVGRAGEGPELGGGDTISEWMGQAYPESVGIDIERPGIVHRLDRDTSGCLLLVKSPKAFPKYKAQFAEKKIKKVYWAIVEGNVKNDTGIIDNPIARARSDFRKKEIQNEFSKDYRGTLREAITRYKVIERLKSDKGNYTLIECYPVTGRTHQIRVHMRSIRHPIIGDQLYGSKAGSLLANRQMLHAKSLEFETYIKNQRGDYKGEKVKVESPMPADMRETLEKLRKIC